MNKIYVFGIYLESIYEDNNMIRGFAVGDKLINDEVDNDKEKLEAIAEHISSDETFCKHDMGVTSTWQHNLYEKAYPDGYELEWCGLFKSCKDAFEFVRGKIEGN